MTSTPLHLSGNRFGQAMRRRPLTSFFALAYLLNVLVTLPLVLSPAGLGVIAANVPFEILMLAATTPTLAALWTQRVTVGDFRICRLAGPWRRLAAGIVGGILLSLLAFVIVPDLLLTGGAVRGLAWPALFAAAAGWWSNPLNLLGGPINEEPGWRGFALPRLQARFGPLLGSVVLGVLWAGWHLPLFWVRGWLGVPVWAFFVLMLCNAILMTCAVNVSARSILPAVLMHAMFNGSSDQFRALIGGLPTHRPGLVLYVAGAVLATALVALLTRGRLGTSSRLTEVPAR